MVTDVNTNNCFKILYANADSLLNKRSEFRHILKEGEFDIAAITEVLPKNRTNCEIENEEWQISGYNFFHRFTPQYSGRGCIIYTKDSISAYQIESINAKHIEELTLGIHCGKELLR